MEWNPEVDARDLAVHLLNLNADKADAGEAGAALDWRPRRFNAAAAYLAGARIVEPIEHMGGDDYWPCGFFLGDPQLRFVRRLSRSDDHTSELLSLMRSSAAPSCMAPHTFYSKSDHSHKQLYQ